MYELDESKYLYLFAVLPVVLLLFLGNLYWQRKKQRALGNPELVKKLTPERSVFKPVAKLILLLLGLSGIIIALVNPKIGTKTETVKREGIDIVFAIDVSKSMLAEDVKPSRLEKAKQIVSQTINQLGNDRIGIVGYAGSAYPVLPITSDYSVAKMFLQSMNTDMVSSQGTAISDALELATTFFDDPQTSKLVILISDGEDHGEGSAEAAQAAEEAGIKIITVGVGTKKGGTIPLKRNGITQTFKRDNAGEVVVTKMYPDQLKTIAEITKGGYVYGNSTRKVSDYVKNALENIEKTEFESKEVSLYESQYQWFLGAAFLLLFIEMFLLERRTAWIRKLNLFNEKE
ncbi:VWA domain-containing protein [Flavobacterium litorale]|uniref:VWA domain-containing protein n=1 Tax=Flavobacterium litorale TaxID=2856519 RepID=A0ABX8VE86_9FLAO|nr:VWA domain-containing protein [Flavobacterium litorale]QYJ68964.1 VWA domain-containing protein [Flavobacterium litorale]